GNLSLDNCSRAGGAWNLARGPCNPVTNTLKLRERMVCSFYSHTQIRVLAARNQHCECFSSARARKRKHSALFYLRLTIECGFEICRKDLETRRGDNRVLTPAAKVDVAFSVNFSDVTRVNPALLVGERLIGAIPVTG